MSDEPAMQLNESLALLYKLDLIEWLSRDVEYSTRLFINTAFRDLLDSDDPDKFFPSTEYDAIKEVLTNHYPPDDWFDLATGRYSEQIEINSQPIGYGISDRESMLNDEEAIKAAIDFAKEWESNVCLALKKAIAENAGR